MLLTRGCIWTLLRLRFISDCCHLLQIQHGANILSVWISSYTCKYYTCAALDNIFATFKLKKSNQMLLYGSVCYYYLQVLCVSACVNVNIWECQSGDELGVPHLSPDTSWERLQSPCDPHIAVMGGCLMQWRAAASTKHTAVTENQDVKHKRLFVMRLNNFSGSSINNQFGGNGYLKSVFNSSKK